MRMVTLLMVNLKPSNSQRRSSRQSSRVKRVMKSARLSVRPSWLLLQPLLRTMLMVKLVKKVESRLRLHPNLRRKNLSYSARERRRNPLTPTSITIRA